MISTIGEKGLNIWKEIHSRTTFK